MEGRGVPRDYVQAYMWSRLTGFEANLSDVKAEMTPDEVSQAEQMAAAWRSQHPE